MTPRARELVENIRTRLLGVDPGDQDLVLEDDDWRLIIATLEASATAPKGEPVAWRYKPHSSNNGWSYQAEKPEFSEAEYWHVEPLYTAPPSPKAKPNQSAVEAIVRELVESAYVDGRKRTGETSTKTNDLIRAAIAALEAHRQDTSPPAEAAEVARLREALEPFAKLADEVKKDGQRPGDRVAWGFNNATLTWGDFHRARAALSGATHDR